MVLVYPFLFSNETVKNSLNFGAKVLQNHRSKRPGTEPKLILWLKTVIERTMRQFFLWSPLIWQHIFCTFTFEIAWLFWPEWSPLCFSTTWNPLRQFHVHTIVCLKAFGTLRKNLDTYFCTFFFEVAWQLLSLWSPLWSAN